MEPAGPFPATDGDTWTGPWPEREWLIPGWLPVGRLGMLSGRGGRGKSRLVLQLAARMAAMPAASGPFVPAASGPGNDTAVSDANLALDTTHAGTVVYASWEDEREEAGRRIAKFGADGLAVPGDLAGRLRYLDLRGEGPLWGPLGEGRSLAAVGGLSAVGRRVRATCEALDARVLDRWIVTTPDRPTGTARRAGAGRWTRPTRARPFRAGNDGKPRPVEAVALSLAKSSYGPGGRRLFLKSSDSENGWLGVSSKYAAQAALPSGIALEGQTHATQGIRDGDPPV